jgi:hypothetical protein
MMNNSGISESKIIGKEFCMSERATMRKTSVISESACKMNGRGVCMS